MGTDGYKNVLMDVLHNQQNYLHSFYQDIYCRQKRIQNLGIAYRATSLKRPGARR